jgi:hypothetical protein
MPSLPVRIEALRRDVNAFHERVQRAHTPVSEPPSPDTTANARELYVDATALAARAASIRDVNTGWDELSPQQRGSAHALLRTAQNAARTVSQFTGVGFESHAPITVSSVAPRSQLSADRWDRATGGNDLPNVRIVGSLTPPNINLVADRLENVPQRAIRDLDTQGRRSTLFSGRLTDVHGFKFLRGVQPRGWPVGATWDRVPGVGTAKGMASNVNREQRGRGHGEDSLSLHELGHVIDIASARPNETRVSTASRWRRGPQVEARARESLSNYFRAYPEEWYAEAVMRYSRSPQTHASLARWYPETYELLREDLGPAQFDR